MGGKTKVLGMPTLRTMELRTRETEKEQQGQRRKSVGLLFLVWEPQVRIFIYLVSVVRIK